MLIDSALALESGGAFLMGLMPDGSWEVVAQQENLFIDLHRRTMAPDEREVTRAEVDRALEDAARDGGVFNGCIHHYLKRRYGVRVRHIMGFGWVVRDAEANT